MLFHLIPESKTMSISEYFEYFEDDIKTEISDETKLFLLNQCEVCKKVFKSRGSLRDHIQIHKERRYSCTQCGNQFTGKGNLKKHIESVHEKVQYPCNQCDTKLTRQDVLRRHIESVHAKVKYPCNLCEYEATTHSNLKSHNQRKHLSQLTRP